MSFWLLSPQGSWPCGRRKLTFSSLLRFFQAAVLDCILYRHSGSPSRLHPEEKQPLAKLAAWGWVSPRVTKCRVVLSQQCWCTGFPWSVMNESLPVGSSDYTPVSPAKRREPPWGPVCQHHACAGISQTTQPVKFILQ